MVETKALTVVSNEGALKTLFEMNKDKIAALIPKHFTTERIFKQLVIAATKSPKLWQCTAESWLESMLITSELGLDSSGITGQAYILPFKNSATGKMDAKFIPGYKGLAKLARQSEQISTIDCHAIHEKDRFKAVRGTTPVFTHEESMDEDRGKITRYYCLVQFKDGTCQWELMTPTQVEAIRRRSKAPDSPAWKNDYNEMAKKTVFKRAAKWLPSNSQLDKAISVDNEVLGYADDETPTQEARLGNDGVKKMLFEQSQKQGKQDISEGEIVAEPQGDGFLDDPVPPPPTSEPQPTELPLTVIDADTVAITNDYIKKHGIGKGGENQILRALGVKKFEQVKLSDKDKLSAELVKMANIDKEVGK